MGGSFFLRGFRFWVKGGPVAFLSLSLSLFLLTACEDKAPPKTQKDLSASKSPSPSSHVKKSSGSHESIDVSPQGSSEKKHFVPGVLDLNRVWSEAKAPAKIREEIHLKRRAYQKEIIQMEEKLRQQDEVLQSQHETLSAEDYKEKRKAFEKNVLEVQKRLQNRKNRLETMYSKALEKVGVQLDRIVDTIAKQRNLDIIFSQAQIVYALEDLNITDSVIGALDTALPHVPLEE